MKPTVIKFIMVPIGKIHLLMGLMLKFMRLVQMEQRNGLFLLDNPLLVWNHFGLLAISLVLEDHEMMY